MKFLGTLIGLLIAVTTVHAENRTDVKGTIAACRCAYDVDNGVISKAFIISSSPSRSNREAKDGARSACRKHSVNNNHDFSFDEESCVYSKAISQTFKKKDQEKTKFRIEKINGDDEANLQADLMSTLND